MKEGKDLINIIKSAQEIAEKQSIKKHTKEKAENAAIVLYKDIGTSDLQIKRREEILKTYCKKRGYNIKVVSVRRESGIFVESAELFHIIDLVKAGEIDVIVISNPFDIAPMSFPLIKKLFESVGTKGARIEIVSSMFDALK